MAESRIVTSLRGWLTEEQLRNIAEAIKDGRLDMVHYDSLEGKPDLSRMDNGGFSLQDQYALRFANQFCKNL